MAEHDGHRGRLKNRFLEYGLDNFDDHTVLELLLFYAMPRQDTNVIAHRLIDTFGSLDAVFEADVSALTAVNGVGEHAATLIRLAPEIGRRYMMAKEKNGTVLDTSADAGRFLVPRFVHVDREQVYLVSLDAGLKVMDCSLVAGGDTTNVQFNIRELVTAALQHKADSVILAHNHLTGIAQPSQEDIQATLRLRDALDVVGVRLADHIIVAGSGFVSLADEGVL